MYDFDELLPQKQNGQSWLQSNHSPPLFIGSYPPVTPPGQNGPFFTNTYFLQPDRKSELRGAVPVRAGGKCS